MEVATGALSTGANAWLTEGGRPLLIEAPLGSGWIAMSTFDWAQGSIVASSDATALLRQTVVRTTYGNTAGSASARLTTGVGNFSNSAASRGGTLSQALGNVPALDLPAWWLIGGLVLIYVLLVGPINYFVMRALGRRALAWITVPAIALVASGGAYGASLLTKGTSVVANEISIVHTQTGWDRAYTEQYTGIVTPTRGDFEIGLGGKGRLISPIDYNSGPNDANLGLMRVNTATGSIALPSMTAFTLRGFATEDITSAPSITGTAQLAGGKLTGTVKNDSSLTFTDGVVISGGGYQTIGRLAPGETAHFSFAPQTINFVGGPPPYMSIYPNALCCSGPAGNSPEVERQNETRGSVLSSLSGNSSFGGVTVSTAPIAVLWTNQPFEQVRVNGAQPRTYVESAVVFDFPNPQVGSGSLPAGIVNGRLIDITANVTPSGPPGLLLASSGSVVYSFQPALAAGSRLSGVTVSSSNPYGGKFIGQIGNGGTVNGQAWDWVTSSWMDVSYLEGGTTSVPQAAVNPTTGEVRLKISSTGQFSAGFASIAGTVS